MNAMITIVKRHPLVTFFALAYLLSWWTQRLGAICSPLAR